LNRKDLIEISRQRSEEPMKTPKTILKELRAELHYWQAVARIETRSLKATKEKCKQIGKKMRKIQAEAGTK
jgi:hypothetical protein